MPEENILPRNHRPLCIVIAVCASVIAAALFFNYFLPPGGFVPGTVVHIEKNASLSDAANDLYIARVIKSPIFLRIIATLFGGRKSVGAGDYLFNSPENAVEVAYRLIHSEQGLTAIKVTFPEGITVRNMGDILAADLSGTAQKNAAPAFVFDENGFVASATPFEGYLFPDTYLFLPNETPSSVISTMKDTFNEKIKSLATDIVAFEASSTAKSYPRTLANIVIMASIIEKEATGDADRRIIAGILWKRLDAGQLLEVDPPFEYALGKTSAQLTLTDLATTSPYNTYVHRGLPPTPIDNPGLDALAAAVTPTPTNYWYYLNDKNGVMHYAATYAQHEANRAKYLQ